ncbi:hypothetical protein GAR05_02737 [Micromonospora saelicesensis]|uniref:Uncharacterized protein n=1 Tax=Micromonospora saelicesensis TaxID=285676 RepID=A0ABX9CJJ7_9ACTN|nr:hypothetical protein [Micromonospora saelicesensis]RAN99492.1 hypothetical protein GAR05_02737 [Micromonospora saelicesensis]
MGDVRGRFRDDLAQHPAPPLGDLVQQSVVQGRRLRRRRRLAQFGAGGSALAMLLVIGLAAGPLGVGADDARQPGGLNVGSPGGSIDTATPSPAGSSDGAPGGLESGTGGDPRRPAPPARSTTVIDTVRIGAGPDGELLTTTPQGALELLTRLLPKGKTSGYTSLESSGVGPGMPYVQLYLDRGDGPGMLRLSIYRDRLGGDPAPGTVELTEAPDNCVQNQVVTVHHRGGLQVDLMISTCLFWDAKGTVPALPVLSVKEAIEIAANPSWGTALPAEYEINGIKRFPKLARSNG